MANTTGPTVTVDGQALRQVLVALVGQPHHIRELQATRSLHKLGYPNPIDILIEQFNAAVGPQAPKPSPAAQGDALTQAARDVLAERQRQISAEGWTPEHDDEHLPGELSLAAASYVCADEGDAPPAIWPWDWSWWKPRDRRRNLVKSGALVLAELERVDRADAARAAQEGRP